MPPSATNTEAPQVNKFNSDVSLAYQNPAIPGFAPDPSVVHVDGAFYLVTSSFHVFPGIPIYVSYDLQTWVHLGNAINRPNQLDLSRASTHAFDLDTGFKMVASGGLWAPTIRHHNGRFYIICTNCCEGGKAHFRYDNFYIWTDDIYSNTWSDPIHVDFDGIDPSLYFDDDGKVYFQGAWELTRESQPSCTIKQMEIDIATGKPLSELRDIWTGHARYDTEGPHIYKKDGYYYLLVAEGGTFEAHMLSIGRSKSIWGPYESCPMNPILTAKGTDEYIQNAGHGELFQDDRGAWWAAVLAVRDEAGGRCPMGRETFLTPVNWPKGEWPSIAQPRTYFRREGPMKSWAPSTLQKMRNIETTSRSADVFIRNASMSDYRFSGASDIAITSRFETLSSTSGVVAFLGKRQRQINFVASTRLVVTKELLGTNLQAGLVVYKDDQRHIGVYYDYGTNTVSAQEVMKHMSINERSGVKLDSVPSELSLTIEGSSEHYRLLCSIDRAATNVLSHAVDTVKMTARDFTGTILGLTVESPDEPREVQFKDFVVAPIQQSPKYISNMLRNARSPSFKERHEAELKV